MSLLGSVFRKLTNAFSRLNIETRASVHRKAFLEGRSVDIVNFNELKIIMFTTDKAYNNVPLERKNYQLTDEDLAHIKSREQEKPLKSPEETKKTAIRSNRPMNMILAHYWQENIQFHYIDIGCQYGTSALKTALFIYQCGRTNGVTCFEPGVAGSLVQHNIKLNGMCERVHHEKKAVSSNSLPTIMYCEMGHSENNRIVNRNKRRESLSYVVDAISIDDYVAEAGIQDHLIIKIDTQGAEHGVLSGMLGVMQSKLISFIMEFTPWALSSSIKPRQLLESLAQTHVIFDTNVTAADKSGITVISPDDFDRFISSVNATTAKWTDLLLLPKELPSLDECVNLLKYFK